MDDVAAITERAETLDPLSPWIAAESSRLSLVAGRPDEAVRHARRALEIDPAYALGYRQLGDALLVQRQAEEAVAVFRQGLAAAPGLTRLRAGEARALAALGRREEAIAIARTLEDEAEGPHYVRAEEIAGVWASIGDRDRAFRWLDRAYEDRSAGLAWLRFYPLWNPLREDPRFEALVRKIGLP